MAGRVNWFGEKVYAKIEAKVVRRLALAAETVKNQVVRNISVPTRTHGPSKAGEFPHADTGKLRQSIFWKFRAKGTAIVGTTILYGLFLELGTSTMAARSFLRRTLYEMRTTIKRILTGGKAV